MVLLARGEFALAEGVLSEDLEEAVRLGDDLLIGRTYYNQAQLAQAQGRYAQAIEVYERCIEICRRSQNTELLLRVYNGLGNATTAWLYGCSSINGALLGLGERTGNTPIEALAMEYAPGFMRTLLPLSAA
jgi:tetratricopeptide (TPR) repeat protein